MEYRKTLRYEALLYSVMNNNPEYVPPEGAIGYDFFNNFTIVVDRGGKKRLFGHKCGSLQAA